MAQPETAIANALARRAELERELREIDMFLDMYRRFTGVAPTDTRAAQPQPANLQQVAPSAKPATRKAVPGIPHAEFVQIAREVFLERGHPMMPPDILDGFHKKGREIGGVDEMRNLTTKLWRARDAIVKIPGAGYWPADVPCPAVGYGVIAKPASQDAQQDTPNASARDPDLDDDL